MSQHLYYISALQYVLINCNWCVWAIKYASKGQLAITRSPLVALQWRSTRVLHWPSSGFVFETHAVHTGEPLVFISVFCIQLNVLTIMVGNFYNDPLFIFCDTNDQLNMSLKMWKRLHNYDMFNTDVILIYIISFKLAYNGRKKTYKTKKTVEDVLLSLLPIIIGYCSIL